MTWYPSVDDPDFYNKLYEKQEFREDTVKIKGYSSEGYRDEGIYQEPYQQFIRKFINKGTPYDSIMLFWALGSGKCFARDTGIIMANGSIEKVQYIQKGDLIMGDDNTVRKVLDLSIGNDMLYIVKNKTNNDSYTVNSSHVLCLKNRNNDKVEISIRDYMNLSNDKKSELLGYKSMINFADRKNLMHPNEYGKYIIEQNVPISPRFKHDSLQNRLSLLLTLLHYHGQNNEHEHTFCIDDELVYSRDIKYLCDSMNIFYEIKEKELNIPVKKLYDPSALPSKKVNPYSYFFELAEYEIQVEPDYYGKYYGFEVDGNHKFLLEDFSVTHNSNGAISILENFHSSVLKENGMEKFLVITKNDSLQEVFIDEIMKDPYSVYITQSEREQIEKGNMSVRKYVIKKIETYYEFINYTTFVNRVIGRTTTSEYAQIKRREITHDKEHTISFNNRLVVIDEIQNITGNYRYLSIMKMLKDSVNTKLILLTATPIADSPEEIIYVSNLLNYKKPLFELNEDDLELNESSDSQLKERMKIFFEKKILQYISVPDSDRKYIKFTQEGEEILKGSFRGKISHVPINPDTFPKKIWMGEQMTNKKGSVKVVKCIMSDYQRNYYLQSLKIPSTFNKIQSNASTIVYETSNNIDEALRNPNYLETTRLDENNIRKYSCKLYEILKNVKDSVGINFIYSNNVANSGTQLVAEMLKQNGYKPFDSENISRDGKTYILFSHELKSAERTFLKNIINGENNRNGEIIKIIIGSPMISEGISFLGVRQIHILEPYWNIARTIQTEARCIRNYSHHNLPEKDRDVKSFWYVASPGDGTMGIDERTYLLCEIKDRINKEVERMLKKIAVDCHNLFSIKREKGKPSQKYMDYYKDGFMECDYQDCDYTCDFVDEKKIESIKPRNTKNYKEIKEGKNSFTDMTTYSKDVDYRQVNLAKRRIKNLFEKGNVWDLDNIVSQKELEDISLPNIYYAIQDLLELGDRFYIKNKGYGQIKNLRGYYTFMPNRDIELRQDMPISDFIKMLQIKGEEEKKELPSLPGPSKQEEPVKKKKEPKQVINLEERNDIILDFYEKVSTDVFGIIEYHNDKPVFKVIDLAGSEDVFTGREQPRGRKCSTILKEDLLRYCEILEITDVSPSFKKLELCKKIYDRMKERGLLLIMKK